MKTLIILLFPILSSGYVLGQNDTVHVNFEVDGEPTRYKNAIAKFFYNKDTISINIEEGKLTIPTLVFKKRATVVFFIDKYLLKFDSIPITLNAYSPKWTLGVDKKPFDKKKFWEIKSWRKVQIVYYFDNDDGRTFTVSGLKKCQVIKKKL